MIATQIATLLLFMLLIPLTVPVAQLKSLKITFEILDVGRLVVDSGTLQLSLDDCLFVQPALYSFSLVEI